jgi:hypothetical protein
MDPQVIFHEANMPFHFAHFARFASPLFLATVILLQSVPAARAETTPTFIIVDPEMTLDPGQPSGRRAVVLGADNIEAANIGKPLEDVAGLDTGLAGGIKFSVRDLDHTNTSRRWLLTAEIDGLPNNVVQKRYLTFRFDGKTTTLPFTVSNKNPSTFVWSVKGPSEISLPPGEPIEISVAIQSVGATKIGLLQSSLLEQSQKRAVQGGWTLCEKRSSDPSTCNGKDINLAPHSTQQLLLYPAKDSSLIGKYVGNVIIGASEKPEGETLALTVYGSTVPLKIAGVVTIFIGVVLAWLLTVYLQNRLNRNQMLLPVTMLRERFQALQAILANRPSPAQPFICRATTQELANSVLALSEATLDGEGLLPPGIPNPFKPVTPNAEAFLHRVAVQTARFELLQLVVWNGLQEIWKQIPVAPNPNQRAAILTAVGAADAISEQTPAPAVADVVTRLQAILTKLNTDLAGGGAVDVAAKSAKPATIGQISTEIRTLSGMAWLVFAVLTTALGTYVLVLSNLGFGTCMDFLVCLFWGFGLPVGGTQLAQSTTATASTALGFSVPRA